MSLPIDFSNVNSKNFIDFCSKYKLSEKDAMKHLCDLMLVKIAKNSELKSKIKGGVNFANIECTEVKKTNDGEFIIYVSEAKSEDLEVLLEKMLSELGFNARVISEW